MEDEPRDDSATESDATMEDLDVPEEQTDDVTGGKKRFGRPEGERN